MRVVFKIAYLTKRHTIRKTALCVGLFSIKIVPKPLLFVPNRGRISSRYQWKKMSPWATGTNHVESAVKNLYGKFQAALSLIKRSIIEKQPVTSLKFSG